MRRISLIVFLLIQGIWLFAQTEGIAFFRGTWAEAVEKARQEHRLLFIDFFTEWCGPCYNMAHQIFTLPSVGDFYNSHFVNIQVDAEKGEGVQLAKKYGVRVFPTYVFVDPATLSAVHRSSSRQEAGQFINTGFAATKDSLRSFYLEQEYANGNRSRQLMIDYILYENSIYRSNEVRAAFDELIKRGAKLTDKDVWPVYCKAIRGLDNPYLTQVSNDYSHFCNLFGKAAVDEKLRKETTYGDPSKIARLCDFEGKALNLSIIRIENLIRNNSYTQAASAIDSLLSSPTVNQQELISRLKFMVRIRDNGEDLPDAWFNKCVEYLRYIAYNQSKRDDPYIHQEYAAALELVLKRAKNGKKLPDVLCEPPLYGKKGYDMRPVDLKPKPHRK